MNVALRKYLAKSLNNIENPDVYELNRWLNKPFVQSREIEKFFPYVERHLQLDFQFTPEEPIINFIFREGKDSDSTTYCPVIAPKTIPRYYAFPYPDLNKFEFASLKTIVFDLGREHIINDANSRTIKYDKFLQPVTMRFDAEYLRIKIFKPELLTQTTETVYYNFILAIPESTELTSSLIPQISKIELLDIAKVLNPDEIDLLTADKKFKPLPKINIARIPNLEIRNDEMMLYYNRFGINYSPVYSINFQENEGHSGFAENSSENILSDTSEIRKLLEPVYELSEKLKSEILQNLPKYQKVGAKMFFSSDFAYCFDQFELGKELQVTLALKMLLRTRKVKKVLILTSSEKENIIINCGSERLKGIWQYNLKLFLPDFAYNFHCEYDSFMHEKKSQPIITGITYKVFYELFQRRKIDVDFIKKFDTIIVDDFSPELLESDTMNFLIKNMNSDRFWILSDSPKENYQKTIQQLQPEKTLKSLGRKKSQINIIGNNRYNYDFYLPLDDPNVKVNNEVFSIGQDKLDDVIGLGNIIRFRPNVFQIFQDEQRKLNFVGDTGGSNKTDLLLQHLRMIFTYENRVMIYTQYEENGLKPIINLLGKQKIDYIVFDQSDSEDILKQKISKCENDERKLVYVTNLKVNRIKFTFPKVSTLINFDNWWNQASRWQLENKLDSENGSLSVYNYYYENTIEDKVNKKIGSLGLNEKLLFDQLPVEVFYSLFDEKDWCVIFGIECKLFEKSPNREVAMLNMKDLVDTISKLLSKLNFIELETSADLTDYSFNIRGKTSSSVQENILAKCFFCDHLSSEFINDIISKKAANNNTSRLFLFTNGTISRTNIILPLNVLLIDGAKLKVYLKLLNIG